MLMLFTQVIVTIMSLFLWGVFISMLVGAYTTKDESEREFLIPASMCTALPIMITTLIWYSFIFHSERYLQCSK